MDTEKSVRLMYSDVTDIVLKTFFAVHSELGHGFLESIYEKAMEIALQSVGLHVARQHPAVVQFRGQAIGDFKLDMVVERSVVVEIKAVSALSGAHEAQLLNYLKATGFRVGLLLNFGQRAQFKRRVA